MLKRILLPLLLAALAAYLFYIAYLQRNVATFLWAVSFTLILITSFTRFMRDTLLVIVSLTITIALVEMGLSYAPHLFGGSKLDQTTLKSAATYFDSNQTYNTPAYWHLGEFGSQPKPGVFRARKLSFQNEVIYDVTYTIGPDGFRSTSIDGQNISSAINFLGDSFTFGEGVEDNQTTAYFVSDLLMRQQKSVAVKNFGMSGGGVNQALAILLSKVDTKADTQFILTSPWHASRGACADFFTTGAPRFRLLTSGTVERDGYCRSFAWVEHSPKALRALITSSKIFNLIQDSLLVIHDQDEQIKLYLGIMKTTAEEIKNRNQKLIVGFIKADENWFVGSYNNEKIIAELKSRGINVIDMTLAAKNEDLQRKYYLHELDKHPTAAANMERAKILIDNL